MADQSTPAAAEIESVLGKDASSSTVTPAKKPRSRWWRYSIRALLLFQVVIAVFVGYVVLRVRGIELQHAAAISILNGSFGGIPTHIRPVKPEWFWEPISQWAIKRSATDVTELAVPHSALKLNDAKNLPYLENLRLNFGVDSAETMGVIGGYKYLKYLSLRDATEENLSDEIVAALSRSKCIESILVDSAKLSDKSIESLIKISTLRNLDIQRANVTPNVLVHLLDNQVITELHIPIILTGDNCAPVASMKSLSVLGVLGFDDRCAAILAQHRSLKLIRIRNMHAENHPQSIKQSYAAGIIPDQIKVQTFNSKPYPRNR